MLGRIFALAVIGVSLRAMLKESPFVSERSVNFLLSKGLRPSKPINPEAVFHTATVRAEFKGSSTAEIISQCALAFGESSNRDLRKKVFDYALAELAPALENILDEQNRYHASEQLAQILRYMPRFYHETDLQWRFMPRAYGDDEGLITPHVIISSKILDDAHKVRPDADWPDPDFGLSLVVFPSVIDSKTGTPRVFSSGCDYGLRLFPDPDYYSNGQAYEFCRRVWNTHSANPANTFKLPRPQI